MDSKVEEILEKLNNNNSIIVSPMSEYKFAEFSKEIQKYSDLTIETNSELYTIRIAVDIQYLFNEDVKAKMDKIIYLVNSLPEDFRIEYDGYSGYDRLHYYLISPDE